MRFSCLTDICFRKNAVCLPKIGFRWLLNFVLIDKVWIEWSLACFCFGEGYFRMGVNLDLGELVFFKTIPGAAEIIWYFDSRRIYIFSSLFLPFDLASDILFLSDVSLAAVLLHLHHNSQVLWGWLHVDQFNSWCVNADALCYLFLISGSSHIKNIFSLNRMFLWSCEQSTKTEMLKTNITLLYFKVFDWCDTLLYWVSSRVLILE